jgi:hypothetical protein
LRQKVTLRILAIIFLTSSALFLLPPSLSPSRAFASSSNARLEVWSPDLHSSNITNLALTPGQQFTVRVNLTNAGPLLGFDVSLNYNITIGPNILQALCYPASSTCSSPAPNNPLTGGLFDPAAFYPPGCSIIPVKSGIDVPPGFIRFAAVVQGGCTVPGTGTLFSITFQVVGIGSDSIDIIQYASPGLVGSAITGGVGNPPATTNVPYDPFSAYFRNKPGIPPAPSFSFPSGEHLSGAAIQFNATQTVDPDNPNAPNHGIQSEPIVYDTDNNQVYDTGEPVILGPAPAAGTPLGAPPPAPCGRYVCPPHNKPDPHFSYVDTGSHGHWVPGDSVVYDQNENGIFDAGDWVITGPAVAQGTNLSNDPLITYVDIHPNNFWDNGYIWYWGDGSSLINTGNVTSHVFQSGPNTNSAGSFAVKLVVYDSDDGLINRQILNVFIGPLFTFDISASMILSKPSVNQGEKLGVTVTLTNTGNQIINDTYKGKPWALASMNVTYDLNTVTTIDSKTGIKLPTQAGATYNYTIDTTNLSPRVYTVAVNALIINETTQQVIPNANPDNFKSQSFTVVSTKQGGIPVYVLAGIAGGAVVVVSAVVYVVRRRKPLDEQL